MTLRTRKTPPESILAIALAILPLFLTPDLEAAAPPATTVIDWKQSGVEGGIPDRTTIFKTLKASDYGNGSTDSSSAINTALSDCPENQVVLLSSGKFKVTSITIPSNVVLRGAGADTILDAKGSGNAVIKFGTKSAPDISNASVAISAGATAGSNQITFSGGARVGDLVLVTELNDSSYVTMAGDEGNCTWCDGGYGWNGTRLLGQIVKVTAADGNKVTVSPKLYKGYTLSPLATPFAPGCVNAGLEDLQIYINDTQYTTNVAMNCSSNCWVRNIESNYAGGDHFQAHFSYRGELRHNYFHDGYTHSPGQTDDDVFIVDKTSAFLVVDNILVRLHLSIVLNWGAAGNVIAYNFGTGNFDRDAYNCLYAFLSLHGAHPQFNLIEGNIGQQVYPDSTWGSGSNNTFLRNWMKGVTKVFNPLTGRGEPSGNGWEVFQANRAFQISRTQKYNQFLGNLVGSPQLLALKRNGNGDVMPFTAKVVAPQDRSYDGNSYGYTFGYANSSDGGSHSGDGPEAFDTSVVKDDYVFTKVAQSPITGSTVPISLFLDAKPAWFGNLSWPAIDVAHPEALTDASIPAGYRYTNGKDPVAGPTPNPTPAPSATPNPTPSATPAPSVPVITDGTVLPVPAVGVYPIQVQSAGTYKLIGGGILAPDGSKNSFWIDFDTDPMGDNTKYWDITPSPAVQSTEANWPTSKPKTWTLSAGDHSLYLRDREPGIKIQTVTFVATGGATPPPTPTPAPTPPPTPPPTPTPTPTPPPTGGGPTYNQWAHEFNAAQAAWVKAHPPVPDQ